MCVILGRTFSYNVRVGEDSEITNTEDLSCLPTVSRFKIKSEIYKHQRLHKDKHNIQDNKKLVTLSVIKLTIMNETFQFD